MISAYTKYAEYYDLIFSHKDYECEVGFIKDQVLKNNIKTQSVLDVGCGTGKHLSLLSDTFTDLYGVDLNKEILQTAKNNYPQFNFTNASMSKFTLAKKFDVITCLYSVFNYNMNSQDAIRTLNNFKKHLDKEGLLIIALYNPQHTEKRVTIHTGKNEEVEIVKFNQFKYNPKTQTEDANFVVLFKDKVGNIDFTVEPDHKYKIYSMLEIKLLLKEVGFIKVKVFDRFTNKTATNKSVYPVVVARF